MTTAATFATAGRAALLGGLMLAGGAAACSLPEPSFHPGQDKLNAALQNLLVNRRVRQAADCSFVNGGTRDEGKGSAAFDLGAGRVAQMLDRGWSMVVTLCDERKTVILKGLDIGEVNNCGEHGGDRASLDPTTGKFDFRAGKDFAGFLAHMDRVGMLHSEDLVEDLGMEHGKDRIDLLCGCQVYYPQTMN